MTRAEKQLDAVSMMRATRDRISVVIHGMTLQEDAR